MTDYLKLAQESAAPTPPAAPENPYLGLVQQDQEAQRTRARTLLEKAVADNPDTAAERQRLSQTSGLPLPVVERNLDVVRAKEQARMVDLARLAQDSPVLARQILDPNFTSTAVDDLDTLSKIERTLGRATAYVMGATPGGGIYGDVGRGAVDVGLGATAGVGEMLFNMGAVVNDALGWGSGAQAARDSANRSREARQQYGLQPESSTGQAVKSGLGSAGQNLALLPAGLARGAHGTAAAAATLPSALMGLGVGSDAYLQSREAGRTQVESLLFGIPQGTIEYLTERIPATKLFGDLAANKSFIKTLGNQMVTEGWTEQATTLFQDFNEWMHLHPEKTVSEYLQERPEAAYQTFIATLIGTGVQTSAIAGINKIVEKASDQALTFQQDSVDEMMKLARGSMLRQRSPDQFRAYVERALEETEGARKEIYVDGEVLAQLPGDVLAQLPQSVQAQIAEAADSGGTVAIPMADVLTVAPGTALEQTLNDHARVTPDAMTRFEAQQAQETLQQDAERVIAQAQDQQAAQQEYETVRGDLAQQIEQSGRYRPAVAQAYAAGLANFFAAYGQRTGLGTQGLYDAYRSRGFRISGAPSTQGGELEQAAYHGSPHRGIEQFTTQKIGTGEGAQAYGWGMYFAGNKDIAEFYRKSLAPRGPATLERELGVNMSEADALWAAASVAADDLESNVSPSTLAFARSSDFRKRPDAERATLIERAIEFYKKEPGQTYTVDVPDDSDLLDYDAPLKDQPEKVKAALGKMGFQFSEFDAVGQDGRTIAAFKTRRMAQQAIKNGNWLASVKEVPIPLTGKDIYRSLEANLGSDQAASRALFAAGIPGLRYLDAGSRGAQAKGKNHNYVIFDDSAVKKTGELYQEARGTFNPKTLEVVLGENSNLTTLWHEMGHFFLEVLTDVAGQPNAPEQLSADYAAFLQWAGVTDEQWRGMSLDEKRSVHEKWARAVEQYVMEGKVPNKDLQPLMRRFSAWLKATYRSIRQFLATLPEDQRPVLNDDIRRVMDRMLATDEQIAQANEIAGLLPDEQADGEAQERLRKRSMADLKWAVKARDKVIKDLQKQAKATRKQIEAEVTEQANALPVYAAKDAIAAAEKTHEKDPTAADMNIAAIADAYGFPSVEAMYRAIDMAGEKADYIEGATEQRMLEEHGDLMNEDAIKQAANEAVHNEARARSLASELRTQAEMLSARADTGQKTATGNKVTVSTLVQAAKQFGANVVRRTPLRDLRKTAWQHTAAERRAGQQWQQATAKGDTAAAVKAKQDQVLNHAAAKAAIDAQAEGKKILEFFARVTKGNSETVVEKGRDADMVNAARAVLALYGVQTPASKNAAAYLEAIKRNDPDAWAAIEPMVQDASANAQPLESLTFEELQGLHEQIEAMWFLAKRSRQLEVDGDLMDIEDAASDLGQRMDAIGIPDEVPGEAGALTDAERRTRGIRFFGAALKRVEQWAEGMDGKYGGPFLKYVFQPVKDAADRYRADRVKFRRKFQTLLDKVAPSLKHGLIEAPELNYTFGRGHNGIGGAELLHALLHTGNDSNKRKLLLGRGWATEGPNGELDTSRWDAFIQRLVDEGTLTQDHFDFLQGVWDLMEETKPLAQKAHRDVFGRYFDEVTANEFVDPFGVKRRGGYVPAQADPEIVQDASLRSLAEMENESMAYSFPQTNRGFTKSRVEYNRPLKLDLRTIPQHLDKVLLFSHMEPAVRGVSKLLRQKGVSQPLHRIDPSVYEGTLLPWLNRSARQQVETPVVGDGRISRVLSTLRSRAGASMMFANLSNTVQQITGISSAAVKVKPKYLLQSVAHTLAHPKASREAVWSASPYMAERASNEVAAMSDEMEKILLDPSIYQNAQAWTQRHAYFLQSAFDNVLSPIVWTAAYNQGVEEGMGEANAIRFADGTVRQTQGSTLPEDVSRIETGPAYARLFTQFVGYFNMIANTNATALKQIANEVGLKKGAGKALYVVLMGLLIPTWVAEAIALAFRGGPGDDDKDGEYLDDWIAAVLGMGTIKGALAQVPFIGQLANAAINRANSNPADDRMSMSPAVSVLESAAGAPASVYKAIAEDGSTRNAVRDVASLVSIATGLPASAIARPIGYAAGVADDRIDPTSSADAVRGLVTGAASRDSRQ